MSNQIQIRLECYTWHADTSYRGHYAILDSDTYYIKLDDDIMYIKPHSFEAMLYEKLQGRFMFISANVINHAGTSVMVYYDCLAGHSAPYLLLAHVLYA